MAIKLPEKKYFTFPELMDRWQCNELDITQLLFEGELVASYHLSGDKYRLYEMVAGFDYEKDGDVFPSEFQDWSNLDEELIRSECDEWIYGFRFLICPFRKTAVEGEFSYVSSKARGHDLGDFLHRLGSPLSRTDVINTGVVMAIEVARFEEIHSQPNSTPREPSTRERDTLLKLVIGMAVDGYGHDPAAAKSNVPKEIADILAGLDMSVSDDTVRKYLKQAADTVLPAKPRPS